MNLSDRTKSYTPEIRITKMKTNTVAFKNWVMEIYTPDKGKPWRKPKLWK